jgi:DNA excision repair protein ERCC-4
MSEDPFNVPLAFHRSVIAGNACEGGLLVMARGLGIDKILRTFIHLYADPRVLVFVMSADSEDTAMDFLEDFSHGEMILETSSHIHAVKSETSAKDRSLIYDKGGVVILSPRVFLMDLLHNRVPVPLVTGVLVPYAHRYDLKLSL